MIHPKAKTQELLLIGGLILTFVISIVLLSSKKELSVSQSQAASETDIFHLVPENTGSSTPLPTILIAKNQDVPLKVLGSKQDTNEPSYLYTELTSKGIVSNVNSTSLSILWLTEAPQQTLLRYGIKEFQLLKKYASLTPTYIHEAKLTKLSPNTLYYYTGHAPITETLTSAPVLAAPPAQQNIIGNLDNKDGTCLVRGMLARNGEASAYATVITETDTWELPLTGLRKADYSGYFEIHSTDVFEVDVLCVSTGKRLYSGTKKISFDLALRDKVEITLHLDN